MQVRKPSDNIGERNFTRATGVWVTTRGSNPPILNLNRGAALPPRPKGRGFRADNRMNDDRLVWFPIESMGSGFVALYGGIFKDVLRDEK